jgi:putative chitinase
MIYDKVQGIFNTADQDRIEEFVQVFKQYRKAFGIKTEFQINAFLAEVREEVGSSLTPRRENLNYSCKALKRIFKYYKRHPREAIQDGRCSGHKANQRKIANKVYAGRIGNYKKGDGYRFRGGGFFQLTGRKNYENIARAISIVLDTDISPYDVETEISTVTMGLLTAMGFYFSRQMYKCKNVDCFTKKINRYTDSYKKRKNYYLKLTNL